ncbi:MAG: hypothetical protein D6712_10590 [Chloroflexi bacterium]|nr:MAG: hypothetical protein D6712_10590 [Chloroflexota bacterium]
MRRWLRNIGRKGDGVYGEPESWEFDYQWDILKIAFWLWYMSGFQRLPTQKEVMEYDPRYISDMELMWQIYAHQHNDSLQMKMLDEFEAKRRMAGASDKPSSILDLLKKD